MKNDTSKLEIETESLDGKLPRHLTMLSGALLNVGTSIEGGIFIVQGILLQELGSPGLVIIMFLIGGVVSLFGTWAYVELGCMRPISGGPKEYLDLAFPKPKAFMAFVFTTVWIVSVIPGQAAAVAIGGGKYFLGSIYGSESVAREAGYLYIADNYEQVARYIAGASVIFITLFHSFFPRIAVKTQDILGLLKSFVLVLAVVMGIVAACGGTRAPPTNNYQNVFKDSNLDPIVIANSFFKILFVYDGWATINYSLDEFIDPVVNLPRASFGAVISCIIMYVGATMAYFVVVPVADLMDPAKGVIGLQFFSKVFGAQFGGRLVCFAIGLASFSCVMCISFASSRLIFESFRDGYLPFGNTCGRKTSYNTPIHSLLLFGVLTNLYIFAPPVGQAYEMLIDLSTYPEWIFYGLSVLGLIVLSYTRKDIPRTVRAPLLGNIFFVLFCAGITIMPFVPPQVIQPDEIPYFVVPVAGCGVILLCCVWWYFQIVVYKGQANSINSRAAKLQDLDVVAEFYPKMSKIEKKPISYENLLIGAGLNLFETSTLGQPFEVTKTQMAASRELGMAGSIKTIYSRGGLLGFYQGLIPWAWIEAATKGSVLIFAQSELEYQCKSFGLGSFTSAILAGMGGGIAQAYTTMGFCTFMKTVEVTRSKGGAASQQSTMQVAREIFAREGIAGINKGVNAVALRQCTNWGSRFGLSVLAEQWIRDYYFGTKDDQRYSKPLPAAQKILASAIGGGLSCWNQPIEVIRVEMQSQLKTPGRPEKMTIALAAKWIHKNNGFLGFYRGVTPRICLGVWQTICMVYGGEVVKDWYYKK